MDQIVIENSTYSPWVYGCAVFACIAYYVVIVLLLARVFKKAGKPAWRAWVPFVNNWTLFTIGGYKGLNLLWLLGSGAAYGVSLFELDPVVRAIAIAVSLAFLLVYTFFKILAAISIQQKLGKPAPFFILAFINLIAPLWLWILALDHSKYSAKKGHQLS